MLPHGPTYMPTILRTTVCVAISETRPITIATQTVVWRSGGGRTGVAGRLIEAAAAWATSIGSESLDLWVMRSNAAAIAVYRRAGFEPIDDDIPPPPPGCADERFMRRPL